MSPTLRARLALLALAAAGLAGCTRTDGGSLPTPPSVPETTVTTVSVLDLSAIALPAAPGKTTTTTVVVGPGRAALSGVLSGPDGPLEGAVVRVERLVGGASGGMDVVTQPEGKWEIPSVLGGRFRVRAWRTPDLAMTTPQVFFLESAEKRVVDLALARFEGPTVSAAILPNPPPLDQPSSLVIQVAERRVDESGIVVSVATPGVPVDLFGTGDWRVRTPNPVVTDSGGRARWQLVCRRVGEQPLSVAVGDVPFPLMLPKCVAPPPEPDVGEPGAETTSTVAGTPAVPRPTTTVHATPTTVR